METSWEPQTAWKPSDPAARENRKLRVCSINTQTRISRNRPPGHGKEGVVGSSPTEGSGFSAAQSHLCGAGRAVRSGPAGRRVKRRPADERVGVSEGSAPG